ncbi:MAG: NfeD family protein [Theionarchaea archaeon]|nr:NfeD family protein [Theionarchaea archaeon]
MSIPRETALRILLFNLIYFFIAAVVIFYLDLHTWLIIPVILVIMAWGIYAYRMNVRMLGMPSRYVGIEDEEGQALTPILETGKIKVKGEIWNACSSRPIKKGERVRVMKRDGMILEVEPVDIVED